MAGPAPVVGRLVSVNVGRPKDVLFRGSTVHTGIWKEPVEGRRTVRPLNVDGDGQGDLAGHGGPYRAVLVYQSEAYRFWRDRLGRDDLRPGHFGENFTVEGLADDEVCVGDRLMMGGALFEVTQPRVTCFRVGMRLGEPRMAALMVSEGRPGFYLRVLQEGEVGAGDEIGLAYSHPARLTVAAVDALLYRPGHPHADIERALSVEALSPGWRGSFEAILAAGSTDGSGGNVGLNPAAAAPPPAWTGFRQLRVRTVVDEALGVKSFHLGDSSGERLPPARGGQFVTLRLPAGPGGTPLSRPYSLSDPGLDDGFRISVKREAAAGTSAYLHDHVAPGTAVDVAAPRGTFVLPPPGGATRAVVLATAGIGVTPALAMLHELVKGPPRWVTWLHVARNGRSHALRAEANQLLARLPGSVRYVAYTQPDATDRLGVDYDRIGRPDAETVTSLGISTGAVAFVCGPAPFWPRSRRPSSALGSPRPTSTPKSSAQHSPQAPRTSPQGHLEPDPR